MEKKIFTILAQNFCLSVPVLYHIIFNRTMDNLTSEASIITLIVSHHIVCLIRKIILLLT